MAAMSNFWQRILTGVLFLAIMIAAIVYSIQSFLIILGIVSTVGIWEYGRITQKNANTNTWVILILHILIFAVFSILPNWDLKNISSGYLKVTGSEEGTSYFLSDIFISGQAIEQMGGVYLYGWLF